MVWNDRPHRLVGCASLGWMAGVDRIGPFALVVQQGELALRTREHPSPMRVGSSMLTLCTPGKRWLILLGAGPLRMPAPTPARAMATKEFEHRPVGYAPRNWWVVHPWVGWLVSMGLVGHDSEESLLLLGGGDTRV